jgi:hypothetical protein
MLARMLLLARSLPPRRRPTPAHLRASRHPFSRLVDQAYGRLTWSG